MKKIVAPYVEQYDLPFLIGAASTTKSAYGVRGIPATFLIDADGKIAWQGHPMELTSATLKKVLRDVKLPKNRLLAYRGDVDGTPEQSKYEKLARNGELAAAFEEVEAVAANPKSTDDEKRAAEKAKTALNGYVDALEKEAARLIEVREVGAACALYESLAREFDGKATGASAKKRLAEIESDKALQQELEAAKELAAIKEQMRDIGVSKSKKRIEALIAKYVGTRASERALRLLR